MADKSTDNLEEAREKSLNESPASVNRTTLIAVIIITVIMIIGIFMIGSFFLYPSGGTQQNANAAGENVGP